MNPVELISSILRIGGLVSEAVMDAMKAGDVSAVEELTKHLPEGARIEARSAALQMAQLAKATEALKPASGG